MSGPPFAPKEANKSNGEKGGRKILIQMNIWGKMASKRFSLVFGILHEL
jgi:hypothetical protein